VGKQREIFGKKKLEGRKESGNSQYHGISSCASNRGRIRMFKGGSSTRKRERDMKRRVLGRLEARRRRGLYSDLIHSGEMI